MNDKFPYSIFFRIAANLGLLQNIWNMTPTEVILFANCSNEIEVGSITRNELNELIDRYGN